MNKKLVKFHKYLTHFHSPFERILTGILFVSILLEFGFPHVSFGETFIHTNELPAGNDEEFELIITEAPRGFGPLFSQTKKHNTMSSKHIWVTAYSSTKDQTDDSPFITANGKYVYNGLVASNFLAFGTKIRFPEYFGNKIFTVNDRMHSRFQNRMDIWMNTRDEALLFGKRKLKYEILEEF